MALIDGVMPGVGKTLLVQIISILATGQPTTPMIPKESHAEWRKSLLAELRKKPKLILIDNARTTINSTALEAILTGPGFNDRPPNKSENVSAKKESVLTLTGNNVRYPGDLSARLTLTRLISKTSKPEERDDFAIKDIELHATNNRPEYVSDILTVIRAWYIAGKPSATKVPNLRSFTNWVKVVGGILEFTGIEDFQTNRTELRNRNDEESQQWEGFLSTWEELFGNKWMIVKDIAKYPQLTDRLPSNLQTDHAEKNPKSFAKTLGIQLGKRIQTVYGEEGLRLEKKYNRSLKQEEWRVMRVVAGSSTHESQSEVTKDLQEGRDGTEENHTLTNDLPNYPQLPANSQESINPYQEVQNQVAASPEKPNITYSTSRIPTEYLVLFTDYKIAITNSSQDSLLWHAPDSGHPCNREMKKESHIQFTKELLTSGIDRRVNAAVEVMKRTSDSNESEAR
jgi:hypothetical protein